MFEFNTKNYVDNVAQTPKEYWEGLHQATLNTMWNDTTQIYTIKEPTSIPMNAAAAAPAVAAVAATAPWKS